MTSICRPLGESTSLKKRNRLVNGLPLAPSPSLPHTELLTAISFAACRKVTTTQTCSTRDPATRLFPLLLPPKSLVQLPLPLPLVPFPTLPALGKVRTTPPSIVNLRKRKDPRRLERKLKPRRMDPDTTRLDLLKNRTPSASSIDLDVLEGRGEPQGEKAGGSQSLVGSERSSNGGRNLELLSRSSQRSSSLASQ